MQRSYLNVFKMLGLLFCLFLAPTSNATADSITGPYLRLPGHIPNRAISEAISWKKLEEDKQIPISFILPLRNQGELEMLIERLYDPNDKDHYRKYLTTEQFIERFAPTADDYKKVIAYAKLLGLTVTKEHSNRTILSVQGRAKTLESAFKVNLYQFKGAGGRTFYAPDNNPEIPISLSSLIQGVVGLDNSALRKPLHHLSQLTKRDPSVTYPSGPDGGFAPVDIGIAYELDTITEDGTGQIVALFELAPYLESDIAAYADYFSLPAPNLHNVLVDGGSDSEIDPEVALDIELVIAVAPNCEVYVYEGPNSDQGVINTYNRIATDNIAKQVSSSWGIGEDLTTEQALLAEKAIFLQMAAQGQSMYAAAGDSGAYGDLRDSGSHNIVVIDPASQLYVTGVGGTTLHVDPDTGAYLFESVWNNGIGHGAGGGGVSQVWQIPSWQRDVETTFSKTHRNVPDVSLHANQDNGYSVYFNGEWKIFGGTSCAAPLWAAFTALVNENLEGANKQPLGFPNLSLYIIGKGDLGETSFHDVTEGTNSYYLSWPGYDNASGWGSYQGANLFSALTGQLADNPPELAPQLNVTMTHSGTFKKGDEGTYHIHVGNQGDLPTSGEVIVAVTLPISLEFISQKGDGWTFDESSLTFTRSNTLQPDESYPTITLKVKVRKVAPSTITPSVTASGGGSESSTDTDPTTVQ